MKKIVLFITIISAYILLSMSCFAANIKEVPNIRVVIDGKQCTFENVPISVNNRTMLPMVAILTNLGVQNDKQHILWNGKESSITVYKDSKKIYLKINNSTAYIDDVANKIDAAPVTYKGRTYIPASFVAQTLGKKVVWDASTDTIAMCDQSKYDKVKLLLEKVNQSMNSIKKNKCEETFESTIEGKKAFTAYTVSEYDNLDKIIHSSSTYNYYLNNNVQTVKVETYNIKNKLYTKNGNGAGWKSENISDTQAKSTFLFYRDILKDIFFAGFNIEKSGSSDIILSGNVKLSNAISYSVDDNIKNIKSSITIDASKNTIKEITFEDIVSSMKTGKVSVGKNIVKFNYDEFQIIIPKEIQ